MEERFLAPLRALLDHAEIKAAIALILSLLAVDVRAVTALVLLVTLDLLTGIRAARKRGEHVTSLALRRTIPKALEYGAFVMAFAVLGNAWPDTLGWATTWAMSFVALTEVKSVVENVYGKRAGEILASFRAFGKESGGRVVETERDERGERGQE